MEQRKFNRRTLVGVVLSDKMDKTRVVRIERLTRHPLYGKTIKKTNKFKAHDEKNESHTGDKVRILESRPISKDKRWCIIEIIKS